MDGLLNRPTVTGTHGQGGPAQSPNLKGSANFIWNIKKKKKTQTQGDYKEIKISDKRSQNNPPKMVITVTHHNYKETKNECKETKPKVPTKR